MAYDILYQNKEKQIYIREKAIFLSETTYFSKSQNYTLAE
jgi:hypothetical protein